VLSSANRSKWTLARCAIPDPKTYPGFAQDENALTASVEGLAANAIGIGQQFGYYAD
jgi:hypothetical protein